MKKEQPARNQAKTKDNEEEKKTYKKKPEARGEHTQHISRAVYIFFFNVLCLIFFQKKEREGVSNVRAQGYVAGQKIFPPPPPSLLTSCSSEPSGSPPSPPPPPPSAPCEMHCEAHCWRPRDLRWPAQVVSTWQHSLRHQTRPCALAWPRVSERGRQSTAGQKTAPDYEKNTKM